MSRGPRGLLLHLALIGSGLLLSGGLLELQAQDDDEEGDGVVSADSLQLVFEREVFNYPMFERRNPFQPQTGDDSLGPRFEDLVLLGVVIDPDPTRSIAVIGARPPGATSEQAATRAFRLRRGDIVGNARVIDIQRRQVLMEVNDFGLSETRMLDLSREPPPPALPAAPADPAVGTPQPDGSVPDQGPTLGDAVDGAVQQGSITPSAGTPPPRSWLSPGIEGGRA